MAETDAINEIVDSLIDDLPKEKKVDDEPLFKVFTDSKIPVSKHLGKSWEKRLNAAKVVYEDSHKHWDEVFNYFNNNQGGDPIERSEVRNGFVRAESTENVVYSNTSTMVTAVYAKNPDITFTTDQDEDKSFATVLQKAINAVMRKKTAPGVNLKPRAKRAVLHAEMTNYGIMKLDYIFKDDSREAALEQAGQIVEKLTNAKDINEVRQLEGELLAIEQTVEFINPAGFLLTNVLPQNLYIDPNCENPDLSDAMWVIEETFIQTDLLNALYGSKNSEGEWVLQYQPTHRMRTQTNVSGGEAPLMEEVTDSQKVESHTTSERLNYIYENMTQCYYVWDKATRRIFLFMANDWTWPIWVWEDRMKLSRFFPYFLIQFAPTISGVVSVGEASYYLDQQDEINDINKEIARIRRTIFNLFFYNKNKLSPDDAKKLVNYLKKQEGEPIYGIDIPDGMTLKDCIESPAPPSLNYAELFNKEPLYASIDRIASTSDALRGTQFKANTTEDAVQTYMTAVRMRVGAKTDAIEDTIADLAWSIAEIMVQHVPREGLTPFLSETELGAWKAMTIDELNKTMSMQVVAGSVEKPTSVFKKKEAVEVAQAIGQFSRGSPSTSLRVILKLLSTAFPELEITKEDWESMAQEMQALMQKGISEKQPTQSGEANGARPEQQQQQPA